MNVGQVANAFECSVSQVWKMKAAGKLPKHYHIPSLGFTRWKRVDIERFIDCECDLDRFNAG
jgi:predicted DNA-binding transcriptional regulator AlpA